MLLSKKQDTAENVTEFVASLKQMTKDCVFTAISAEDYKSEMLLNAFVSGLRDESIHQRLLEATELTFDQALTKARALELAQENTQQYRVSNACNSVANTNENMVASTGTPKQGALNDITASTILTQTGR